MASSPWRSRSYPAMNPDSSCTRGRILNLPSVYDKIKADVDAEDAPGRALWAVWPLRRLYGVYKAAVGGGYLLQRRKVVDLGALKNRSEMVDFCVDNWTCAPFLMKGLG